MRTGESVCPCGHARAHRSQVVARDAVWCPTGQPQRSPMRRLMCCLIALLMAISTANAGENANGTATLSWDDAELVTDLPTLPASTFPIFVHLRNAPDVRALALNLRWFADTSYTVLPAAPSSDCGWSTPTDSLVAFDGDSTYTGIISFPSSDQTHSCVRYMVVSDFSASTPTPADFVVLYAITKDSFGAIDTLLVNSWATTLGGALNPLTVSNVYPRQVSADGPSAIDITGWGFEHNSEVTLVGASTRIRPDYLEIQNPTRLTPTVDIPETAVTDYALHIRLSDGRTVQLDDAVTIMNAVSTPTEQPLTPTNDAFAFDRFDLNANRTAFVHMQDHFLSDGRNYPSSLDTAALLVTRSAGDTLGIFQSRPYAGLDFPSGCCGHPSYIQYNVVPPQFATSVGLLAMAQEVYSGSGGMNDDNKPGLRLRWTFIDGDTLVQDVLIGRHIRSWRSGNSGCGPFNSAKPDLLTAQIYAGTLPSPPWPAGLTGYYDAQEIHVSARKRISALRISASDWRDDCLGYPTSPEMYLYGIGLWPNFRIANASVDTVALQQQTSTPWNTDAYGGYMYGTTLVGQNRTLGSLGCAVACLSMVNKYYGVAATPRTLNQFLQSRPKGDGFFFAAVARISGVFGDSVTFTIVDTTAAVGPTFLIDDGRGLPRATILVLGRSGTAGWGRISQRFRSGVVNGGDWGVVYDQANYFAASDGFSNGKWRITGFHRPATAALVESTLTTNTPALLYTGIDASHGAMHWVVADGWQPAYVSNTVARGTYSIKDPAYTDGAGPLRRLLQSPHVNKFQDALACSLVTHQLLMASIASVTDTATCFIRLQGAASFTIRDPNGGVIAYDPAADLYDVGVPGAIALRRSRIVDPADPSAHTGTSDVVQIDHAASGVYQVIVSGEGTDNIVLGADATGGNDATSRVIVTAALNGGHRLYQLAYTPSTVALTDLTGVEVGDEPRANAIVSVRPNPVRNTADISFQLGQPGPLDVGVFDVTGRRVATVWSGDHAAGNVTTHWNGYFTNGSLAVAGVYLIRVSGGDKTMVKRVVVLR